MQIRRVFKFAADEWRYRRIARKYRRWSMVRGANYISNLRIAAQVKNIAGVVVECGTWRGGMIAGIADVLGGKRRYYLFDSFEGLPPAQKIDGTDALAWQADTSGLKYYNNCTASEEEAREVMSKSPAVDYRIIKGWFNSTLSEMDSSEEIALLRMDADWYDSTKCILDHFGDRVVPGGIIIVDDYYTWEGCTIAVNEYAAAHKWRIQQSRYAGVCFIKK
jgi:O-methyltransferase